MSNSSIVPVILSFFVIPFVVGFLADRLFSDILKVYTVDAFETENL